MGHRRRNERTMYTVAVLGALAPVVHAEFFSEPVEITKLHSSLQEHSAPIFRHGATTAMARAFTRGSSSVQSSDSLQVILAESLKGSKGGRVISERPHGRAKLGWEWAERLRIITVDYCGLHATTEENYRLRTNAAG